MKAEIIAVGSELLTPDRLDTNSLFLTEELNTIGIEVVRKTVVGDNRDLLAEAFRDALKESPYQYIRNRRLKLAQQLLESEPATKIYQVAKRTGFTSAKQLSMSFCQEFGLSPREYQRSRCK